jgi:hypothetical protein
MAFQDPDQKKKSPHFRVGEEEPVNLVETPEVAAENSKSSEGVVSVSEDLFNRFQ